MCVVCCMWRTTRSPPWHSARCLLRGCSLPRLLARSLARLHPFPRYPPSLRSPSNLSMHVRHSKEELPLPSFLARSLDHLFTPIPSLP